MPRSIARPRGLFGSLRRAHPILYLVVVLALAYAAYTGKLPGARPAPHEPEALSEGAYLVERVVDGDTLVLAGGAKVRLIGVDTPETKDPRRAPEPFGPEATEFTRRLVEGREVTLKFDLQRKDRYGRFLAYVYVGDRFVNEEIIRAGMGQALVQYPFSRDMKRVFLAAQDDAQQARRGIWSVRVGGREKRSTPESRLDLLPFFAGLAERAA